jgi:hypothetical protein
MATDRGCFFTSGRLKRHIPSLDRECSGARAFEYLGLTAHLTMQSEVMFEILKLTS